MGSYVKQIIVNHGLIVGAAAGKPDLTEDVSGTTAYNLLVGNSDGTVTPIPPGDAGTALISNGANSNPSFQSVNTTINTYALAGLPNPSAVKLALLSNDNKGFLGANGSAWNYLNGRVFDVTAFGADPKGIADSTLAINAAITAAEAVTPASARVFLPPGTYRIDGKIQISSHRTSFVGSGRQTTQLKMTNASDGAICLQLQLAGGPGQAYDIAEVHLADFAIISSDTTHQKIGIKVIGATQLIVENVDVYDLTGNGSIGLQYCGHNACLFDNIFLWADLPISIEANPNSPYRNGAVLQDLDHVNFHNLYVVAISTTLPCIDIKSGVTWTALSFTGMQAWVGGNGGLRYLDTTTTQVVGDLVIPGPVRYEQSPTSGAWFIDLEANHALQNIFIGNVESVEGVAHNGIKLRKAFFGSIHRYTYTGTHSALDIDGSDTINVGSSSFFQTGSTVSFGTSKRVTGGYNLGNVLVTLARAGFVTVTGNYTMTQADSTVLANATTGSLTVTLPLVTNTNQVVTISKTDSTANTVTVACASTNTFLSGGSTVLLSTIDAPVSFVSNGINWCKVGSSGAIINSNLSVTTLSANQSVTTASGTFGNAYPNLLSAAMADFETGIGSWRSNPSVDFCTVAQTTDKARYGTHSLKVTAKVNTSTFLDVQSGTTATITALPSTQYTVLASFLTAVTARGIQMKVTAFNSSFSNLGKIADTGSLTQDNTSTWTQLNATFVTPGTTAYLIIELIIQSASGNIPLNEVHYIDGVSLSQSPSLTWIPPGANLPQVTVDSNGVRETGQGSNNALPVLSQGSGAVQVNVAAGSGTGGIAIGDGAGNVVGSIDSSGNLTIAKVNNGPSGTFTTTDGKTIAVAGGTITSIV